MPLLPVHTQIDEKMKADEKFVLLDVREPQEFVDVFVPGSVGDIMTCPSCIRLPSRLLSCMRHGASRDYAGECWVGDGLCVAHSACSVLTPHTSLHVLGDHVGSGSHCQETETDPRADLSPCISACVIFTRHHAVALTWPSSISDACPSGVCFYKPNSEQDSGIAVYSVQPDSLRSSSYQRVVELAWTSPKRGQAQQSFGTQRTALAERERDGVITLTHWRTQVNVPLYLPLQSTNMQALLKRAVYAVNGMTGTELNPDFLKQIAETIPDKSTPIAVMCMSGGTVEASSTAGALLDALARRDMRWP